MPLEIDKVMILSTSHITREDSERLHAACKPDACAGPTCDEWSSYGWWVYLPTAGAPGDEITGLDPASVADCWVAYGMSAAFVEAGRFAAQHGCKWIRFDCDGDTTPELTTFEW